MASSSESSDSEIENLKQSMDITMFKINFYKQPETATNEVKIAKEKSSFNIKDEKTINPKEFKMKNELQKQHFNHKASHVKKDEYKDENRFAKFLSLKVEQSVEFCQMLTNDKLFNKLRQDDGGLKLLKGFKNYITINDNRKKVDNFYQLSEESSIEIPPTNEVLKMNEKLVSQRNLDDDQSYDLDFTKIPETMQNFFAKKLSHRVSNIIDFVEIEFDKKLLKKYTKYTGGLKLLNDSPDYINISVNNIPQTEKNLKSLIKKRKFEADPDDDMTKSEKLKSILVEPYDIINKTGMELWKDRKHSQVLHYKNKSGPPFYFIEPENEFSELRRKKSWSFKKIARKKCENFENITKTRL